MPMLKCKRCGGFGHLVTFDEACPTCSGGGMLYVPTGYPKGDKTRFLNHSLKADWKDILVEDTILFYIWNWLVDKYSQNTEWWAVHHMYPILLKVEKLLLERNIIPIEGIPGGPHRPEVKNSMAENYRPYHAIKEKAKQDPTDTLRLKEQTKELERKVQNLTEQIQQLKSPPEDFQFEIPVEEEPPMPEATMKDRAKNIGKRVASNAKRGAIQGAVGAANEAAVTALETQLGEKYPEMLKTPAGRAAIKAMIPMLIMTICEFDAQDKIPGKQHVQLAADYALQDVSREAVQELTQVLLANLGPILYSYQAAGKQIEQEEDFSDLEDFVSEREAVVVEEAEELLAR